jgi:predicted SnoaL-like aldol condensation-catalyzing enzyme
VLDASRGDAYDRVMEQTITTNKANAELFLKLACTDVPRAYRELTADGFRHHNVHFPGNAAALRQGMEENVKQFPQKAITVKKTIEEGDQVAVMSELHLQPGDRGFMLVHIFRFKNGKIAELWDVAQEIPANSPNELGPF